MMVMIHLKEEWDENNWLKAFKGGLLWPDVVIARSGCPLWGEGSGVSCTEGRKRHPHLSTGECSQKTLQVC